MSLFWRRVFRLPQTYFLIVGAGLGYLAFIKWLGVRPITLIMGGVISLGMAIAWFQQLAQWQDNIGLNLLESDSFLKQLRTIEQKLAEKSSIAEWQETLKWARESQEFAQRIVSRESTLLPELLETLHTVLGLSNQVAEAILTREQVQTDTYRTLTQQHLQTSCNRLQETHQQLQYLQDQVLLSSLDMSNIKAGLPHRLRGLIADNKTALNTIIQDSSPKNGD